MTGHLRFESRSAFRLLFVQAVLAAGLTGCVAKLPPPALPGATPPGESSAPRPAEPIIAPQAAFDEEERHRISRVQPWVQEAARQHQLDTELINGVIWVESRFDPRARSSAGARGLMQLMPATAAELARQMGRFRAASYDPEFNIEAGSLYLAKLIERYDGDVRLGLAAYNAGAGNVDRWLQEDGKLPPRSEQYVALVLDARARFESWHRPPAEISPPAAQPPAADTMLASKPRCPRAPGCPGPTLGLADPPKPADDHETRRNAPRGRPSSAVAVVPEPPVRYDLDRVETDYEPTPAAESPIRDTPLPPETFEPEPATARPAKPESPKPQDTEDAPDVGRGVLPSVLD